VKKSDVLALPSMPLASPTFPHGPFRFTNREYLVVSYETDPAAIRAALPEPLQPAGNVVSVQWLALPDGEGFGAYTACAQVIPCTLGGKPCSFIGQMYVDNTSPLCGGREIWGYPMKFGHARLEVAGDTLTGSLDYAGQPVAMGTMTYKHKAHPNDAAREQLLLARTQVTLKIIPDIDGRPAIAQLVGVDFQDVQVHGAWVGAARLQLTPAVNAALSDLPVGRVVGGLHLVTDMTLPYGRVLHDYLA
jgi:acetoacetate decarboxylase